MRHTPALLLCFFALVARCAAQAQPIQLGSTTLYVDLTKRKRRTQGGSTAPSPAKIAGAGLRSKRGHVL